MRYAFKVFRKSNGKLLSFFPHGEYTLEYFPGKVAKASVGKIFCYYSFLDAIKDIQELLLRWGIFEIWLVEAKNLETLPIAAKHPVSYERFWRVFDQGESCLSNFPPFFKTPPGTLISSEIKPVKFLLSFGRFRDDDFTSGFLY